jgi:23S rRNA (cytosine1962-C5)-methyltransferase
MTIPPPEDPARPLARSLSAREPTGAKLLDCGAGRRLDRFGALVLDRPAPSAAQAVPADPGAWAAADARYDRPGRGPGTWSGAAAATGPWPVKLEGLAFELRLGETGRVGLFPEQVPMWRWLRRRLADAGRPPAVLNLFAHTGGSTLAVASAGASVVHVDGSRAAVEWARRNATLSGLTEAPIRWIVEDVETFVRRELSRGHRYDAVVLDPPSYGHGPNREQWRLGDRLPDLLRSCAALTSARRAFLLVTTHTPGFGPDRLGRELAGAFSPDDLARGRLESGPLDLVATSGARLPLGAFARWTAR